MCGGGIKRKVVREGGEKKLYAVSSSILLGWVLVPVGGGSWLCPPLHGCCRGGQGGGPCASVSLGCGLCLGRVPKPTPAAGQEALGALWVKPDT